MIINSKKTSSKQGFTLIELLGVIVIVAILSSVAIISVTKLISKNRMNYYISQEKMITLASKNYTKDYKNQLPKEVGGISKLKLQTLHDKKYLSTVNDYKKKECDLDASYILIYKQSATKYIYYTYLECPDYKTKDKLETDESYNINISYNNLTNGYNPESVTIDITSRYDIASYNYIIYRNNKEVENSGNIKNSDPTNKTTKQIILPFKKYKDGEYKIKVIVINKYGTKGTKTSSSVYIDKTPPTCNKYTYKATDTGYTWKEFNKNIEWTNQNRRIRIQCNDTGSGCINNNATVNQLYSQTGKIYSDDIKQEEVILSDKVGNLSTCLVEVKIDKTAPTCEGAYISTKESSKNSFSIFVESTSSLKWTNKDRKGKVVCKDDTSGCTKNSFSKEYTTSNVDTKTDNITISDKAGNKTDCPLYVMVDKTAPTCTKSGDSTTWTNQTRTIKYGCSDSNSGCKSSKSGSSLTFSTTTKTATIDSYEIEDEAGNKKTCEKRTANVYVDTTGPSCTNSGDSTTWTKETRTIKYGCSDSNSGCKTSKSGGSKEFSTTTKTATINSYEIEDKAGNKKTCTERTANVYVDKTPPSCTNSGDSTIWTNKNRTIEYGCSDSDSGCNPSKSGSSKTFTTTMQTAEITSYEIEDKVGNKKTCEKRTANVYIDKIPPEIINLQYLTGDFTDCGDENHYTHKISFNVIDNNSTLGKGIYYKWQTGSGGGNDREGLSKADEQICTTYFLDFNNVEYSICDTAGNCITQ